MDLSNLLSVVRMTQAALASPTLKFPDECLDSVARGSADVPQVKGSGGRLTEAFPS